MFLSSLNICFAIFASLLVAGSAFKSLTSARDVRIYYQFRSGSFVPSHVSLSQRKSANIPLPKLLYLQKSSDDLEGRLRKAKKDYSLTGKIIGNGEIQYLLAGKYKITTSGKSQVCKFYQANEDGLPTGA